MKLISAKLRRYLRGKTFFLLTPTLSALLPSSLSSLRPLTQSTLATSFLEKKKRKKEEDTRGLSRVPLYKGTT